jgi:hydrogenase expression/formation protein HypE
MSKFEQPTLLEPVSKAKIAKSNRRYEHVRLSHGSGGLLTLELIEDLFAATFHVGSSRDLNDAAVLGNPGGRIAFSTDSHSVHPIFFPGGDIGRLAVSGTVNDLAVMGAKPCYLSAGFLLEEGLAIADLERIVQSMQATALEAGVEIVAGDTKVLERGKGDGVFINTAGIGFVPDDLEIGLSRLEIGDVLVVNGTLGDHGIAVMSTREGFELNLGLHSDVAPLNGLIAAALKAAPSIHFMRDLTRGGLAAVANEMVRGKDFGVRILEQHLPIREDVLEYSEMLGIDPLLIANEGKVMFALPKSEVAALLEALQAHPLGQHAAMIGDIIRQPQSTAIVETAYGSRRMLEMPLEEQLPRIC